MSFFGNEWVERNIMKNIAEHKKTYPNFNDKRVIEYIKSLDERSQRWAVFQPISRFSEIIRKQRRFKSFCDSQS